MDVLLVRLTSQRVGGFMYSFRLFLLDICQNNLRISLRYLSNIPNYLGGQYVLIESD